MAVPVRPNALRLFLKRLRFVRPEVFVSVDGYQPCQPARVGCKKGPQVRRKKITEASLTRIYIGSKSNTAKGRA
jgi:hypothetical protein